MNISITITADSAEKLQAELRALLIGGAYVVAKAGVSGPIVGGGEPADDDVLDQGFVKPTAPLATKAATRGRPKTTAAKPAPADGLLSEAPKESPLDDAPAEKEPPVDPAKLRTEAVGLLRAVYSKGAPGEKAVADVCSMFGVAKLVDVPLAKAGELLAAASAAHIALVGPVPA